MINKKLILLDIKSIQKFNKVNYFLKNILIYNYLYKFLKMKQYGKTYRVIMYKNFINFRVGKSHKTRLIYKNHFKFIKKKKNLFFIKIAFKDDISFLVKNMFKIRMINKYTKRGIRLNKFKYGKRYGKISQAFMGLH